MKIRFSPRESALLIACALSDGLATKKSPIGMDEPAVGPFSHEAPDEFRCAEGTNTS